ncbi:MAG: pentapeptide repeat-containing protein [Armatimonadota bacterium]
MTPNHIIVHRLFDTADEVIWMRLRSCIILIIAVASTFPARAGDITFVNELSALKEEARLQPGGDMSGATLPATSFRDVQLSDTNWSGADLRGGIFVGTDLQGANFSDATLRGIIFRDTNLSGCIFSDADLSGATFLDTNLAGTDMAHCTLSGTSFSNIKLSVTGGSHGPVLADAISRAAGLQLSLAEVSALSGDAFAFTYNVDLPQYWSMRPYYHHPVLAAGRILGLQIETHQDRQATDAAGHLKAALDAGKVCMIAMRPPQSPVFASYDEAVWGLISAPPDKETNALSVQIPPVGAQQYGWQDLESRWKGPYRTLYPAGDPKSKGTYPLITITPVEQSQDRPKMTVETLRQASRVMTDARTYGPLIPGIRGLVQLGEDLHEAGTEMNRERMNELLVWAAGPRKSLIGGRTLAATFCRSSAQTAAPQLAGVLLKTAALFETEVSLLQDNFPIPDPDSAANLTDEELATRFIEAGAIIEQVRATEEHIADILSSPAQ